MLEYSGLNGSDKWDVVRDKINESAISIISLQETKHETFDISFLRKFLPRRFDSYEYTPSIGASRGILVAWNSSHFLGAVIESQPFGITLEFISVANLSKWKLTTVYGPCQEPQHSVFIKWLRNHTIADEENWLFLGDFNFYRSTENRNKPGGNFLDTLIFNDTIGHLGLVELPLKGRAYTWSNMQNDPLLEQLDWFFTSFNWTLSFPNSLVLPMAKITSDHIPCKISIGTAIPKANIFRFENFWVDHPGFLEAVARGSEKGVRNQRDSASVLSGKLKNVRYELKSWSKSLSNLSNLISNCNKVILFLDELEEIRVLLPYETTFRSILKDHLTKLLKSKNLYWRKRYTVNRVKFGDECTKFFHAMATISYRRNTISQ